MNPNRSPKNPESNTPTSSPEQRRRASRSPASPTAEQGPSAGASVPRTGEASRQRASVPIPTPTDFGRQIFQFTASSSQSCATQSRGPLTPSPTLSQIQGGSTEIHNLGMSMKRSANQPPGPSGTPVKRQYEPTRPTPRQRSPEPILGRPTIDQFMQRPRGRYHYQQQQLRDFNRVFMERIEQLEYEQEEGVDQIYYMPADEEQSEGGGQAGPSSEQEAGSPTKRGPQPSPGSSPSK